MRLVTSAVASGASCSSDRSAGAAVDDLLEVVHQQQDAPVMQRGAQQVLDPAHSVVPNAQRLGDGARDERGVAHRGQVDEHDPAGKVVAHLRGRLYRQPALADATRPCQRDQPGVALEQVDDRRELPIAADERGERRRQRDGRAADHHRHRRARTHGEPLREQGREIGADELCELFDVGEVCVGRAVVVPDPIQQRLEPLLLVRAFLDVHELRHLRRRQPVLVLEPRDLLARRDPSVPLAVEPDEDVTLLEVRPIQITRRMRPRPELEHHGSQEKPLDRRAHDPALRGQLLERGTHEHPQALVRRADRASGRGHGVILILRHPAVYMAGRSAGIHVVVGGCGDVQCDVVIDDGASGRSGRPSS